MFVVNLWNLLDLTIIGLFAYDAFLIYEHVNVINPSLDDLRQVKDVYHETYWLTVNQQRQSWIVGGLMLASWIKVR